MRPTSLVLYAATVLLAGCATLPSAPGASASLESRSGSTVTGTVAFREQAGGVRALVNEELDALARDGVDVWRDVKIGAMIELPSAVWIADELAKLLGRPTGFRVPIREARLYAGAGFVTAMLGDMRMMPGLPSHPGGEKIDIDADGNVVGLF